MANLFKMARRNVWRNKRRTLITAASILFAVFFATLQTSIQRGTWDHMVDSVVNYHFGYLQIHKQGFWSDKTIDNCFDPSAAQSTLREASGLEALVPRVESFALASNQNYTKGSLVVGIEPELEDNLTQLKSRLVSGSYLEQGDRGVLVAEGLAKYLHVSVGDTLVLIGQGYHGINAAGKLPVRGLIHLSSPELNKQLLYMDLSHAQWFYGTGNRITTLIADVSGAETMNKVAEVAKSSLPAEQYEVMDYTEMLPDLIQARELDLAGGRIMTLILYIIVSFGIFGTLLMMVQERQHEFGILKAIGMKSYQINIMLWVETIILGLVGCLAGVMVCWPIVQYFKRNPIELTGDAAAAYEKFGVQPLLPASADPSIFFQQGITVFIIITLLSLYPIAKIIRLHPVKAMRS